MFNPLRSTTIGALEQTLAFTEKRHQLLAGNIANMSTPDYRSRDLDVQAFRSALADSVRGSHASPLVPTSPEVPSDPTSPFASPAAMFHRGLASAMRQTNSPLTSLPLRDVAPGTEGLLGSIGSPSGVAAGSPVPKSASPTPQDAMGQIIYHDGSDISLEEQVTQISKNKHMHDLAITTMRNQFDLMRAAITERA